MLESSCSWPWNSTWYCLVLYRPQCRQYRLLVLRSGLLQRNSATGATELLNFACRFRVYYLVFQTIKLKLLPYLQPNLRINREQQRDHIRQCISTAHSGVRSYSHFNRRGIRYLNSWWSMSISHPCIDDSLLVESEVTIYLLRASNWFSHLRFLFFFSNLGEILRLVEYLHSIRVAVLRSEIKQNFSSADSCVRRIDECHITRIIYDSSWWQKTLLLYDFVSTWLCLLRLTSAIWKEELNCGILATLFCS